MKKQELQGPTHIDVGLTMEELYREDVFYHRKMLLRLKNKVRILNDE